MTMVEIVKAKIKGIACNKGHVRLFAVASIIWVAITAPVLWKPLPYVEDSIGVVGNAPGGVDVSSRRMESCPAPPPAKWNDPVWNSCMDRVTTEVKEEVSTARTRQLLSWASIVFLVPVILPLLLSVLALLGAIILQWVNDGYRKGPPASPT